MELLGVKKQIKDMWKQIKFLEKQESESSNSDASERAEEVSHAATLPGNHLLRSYHWRQNLYIQRLHGRQDNEYLFSLTRLYEQDRLEFLFNALTRAVRHVGVCIRVFFSHVCV